MGESIEALRTWRLFDDRFQLGLMDKQAIEEDLVPGLRLLAEEYSQGESIGMIFQRRLTKLVEESKKVGKSLFGKLERSREPKLDKESLNELIYVGSFHNAFIQIARRGPVTETADTQVTDVYFTEFLETYLPPQDANEYNGSDRGGRGGNGSIPFPICGKRWDEKMLARGQFNSYAGLLALLGTLWITTFQWGFRDLIDRVTRCDTAGRNNLSNVILSECEGLSHSERISFSERYRTILRPVDN
jgi:hypothetical protein